MSTTRTYSAQKAGSCEGCIAEEVAIVMTDATFACRPCARTVINCLWFKSHLSCVTHVRLFGFPSRDRTQASVSLHFARSVIRSLSGAHHSNYLVGRPNTREGSRRPLPASMRVAVSQP